MRISKRKLLPVVLILVVQAPFWVSAGMQGSGNPKPFQQKIRTLHAESEFLERLGSWSRLDQGVGEVGREAVQPFIECRPLPWNELTAVAQSPTGDLWVGTVRGAIRLTQPCERREYFAGKRWLPDDHVLGIAFEEGNDAVWLKTETGYSRIEFRSMTLAEKATHFEARVRERHVRHGLTADSHLSKPGDVSTSRPVSTDNDGLWTAMYLAAESFRYAVTGSGEAKEYAEKAARALIRLEAVTGIPGFPARSIIEVGREEQPVDGEWHPTADGRFRWKGDTSSDEIVGHYFGLSVYYDLVADAEAKREVAGLLDRITLHILDNGYHLVDLDGKPTRWGWWAPQEIWADPDETGLRALHLLAHLRTAMHTTLDANLRERYAAEYQGLIEKHRYHLLTRNQKINYPGMVNHSDDELAFLSYYPLLRYEDDPSLLAVYKASLERSWQVERPERNPLWNFIYAVGSGKGMFDRSESLRTLQEIPWDLVRWSVKNSHRLDVPLNPLAARNGEKQSLQVLPYDELPMMKWNGNPYQVDGGREGMAEDDGAFFLLPYWLGRYHLLIED